MMLKNYAFVLSLLTLIMLGGSQTAYGQLFVGGKIGGSSTSLTGIGLQGFQPTPKMYLNGGAAVSFSLSKRFSIQGELMYSGKGSAIQYYGEYSTYRGLIKLEQKLHYFATPLVLQFKLGDRENYFHIDGGVVFNTLLGNKFIGSITVEEQNGDVTVHDFTEDYRVMKTDFGYAFGIGLVANGLTFDFRYEIGKSPVYSADENQPDVYNRAFLVSIGYLVNLL